MRSPAVRFVAAVLVCQTAKAGDAAGDVARDADLAELMGEGDLEDWCEQGACDVEGVSMLQKSAFLQAYDAHLRRGSEEPGPLLGDLPDRKEDLLTGPLPFLEAARSDLDQLPLSNLLAEPGIFVQQLLARWHRDVFADRHDRLQPNEYLLRVASANEWLVLFSTLAILSLIDFCILRRYPGGVKNNVLVLAFWVCAGVAYNVYFAARYGVRDGLEWCTGFLLEWMLSVDNLFIFHMIFKVYQTPERLMHKALFFGILGGVLCRIFIFFALGTILQMMWWVRVCFGFLLIYSGVQAVVPQDPDHDVSKTYAVRSLRKLFGSRLVETYDTEGSLFPRLPDGRFGVSLVCYVIVCLEVTDVVFAVDSVSAKVAQLSNQYIAYSSSVMAIFGLRAMFFVIKDLIEFFDLLKYGLCIILVFIGVELIASPLLHLESATVCIVIASVFTVSLTASTAKRYLHPATLRERIAEDAFHAKVHEAC